MHVRGWWMVAWLAACGGADPVTDEAVDTTADSDDDGATTYHGDVRAVLERHCEACHVQGGVAPFSVTYRAEDWVDGPPDWAAAAVQAVREGTMPPWSPSDDCHPLKGSRSLPQGAYDKLMAWADEGFVEGDPAAYRPRARDEGPELGPPTLELSPSEAYTPDRSRPDDYRCFVLDHDFDAEAWLTAFTVTPDQASLVHHVILYRLDPRFAEAAAGWDAADEGPGYTCFGSPGTWEAETVAGWAPGSTPEVYPEGIARRIVPGSVLVLQMHYNTLNFRPEDVVPSDRTGVRLWLGERPASELLALPFAKTDLMVPAGNPDVVEVMEVDLDFLTRRVPVRGAFPHMHQLGTRIRVDALYEDGTEACMIDVPAWDFNWQQAYFYEDDDPIWVGRRDRLRITCAYDNSAANQPVVNGQQLEAGDVRWGDGSLDEMCLSYLYFTLPVSAE